MSETSFHSIDIIMQISNNIS